MKKIKFFYRHSSELKNFSLRIARGNRSISFAIYATLLFFILFSQYACVVMFLQAFPVVLDEFGFDGTDQLFWIGIIFALFLYSSVTTCALLTMHRYYKHGYCDIEVLLWVISALLSFILFSYLCTGIFISAD